MDALSFTLHADDPAAPDTIRDWVSRRLRMKKNRPGDPQIIDAMQCADAMEKQRAKNEPSVP